MSTKQIIKAAVSVAGVATGIALYNNIPGVQASPVPAVSHPLFEMHSQGFGVNILMSSVAPTIFGEDATDFDYHVHPITAGAIEAVGAFAAAHASGNANHMLSTFLNATMAGTMTASQAANTVWMCGELSGNMASKVAACAGVPKPAKVLARDEADSEVEKRSRWSWIRSAAHIANRGAVQILYGALGNAAYANFPSSPRSWCNNADGSNACFSWSAVESFQHNYAQQFVSDALSAVDFDHYSAQANKVLSRKRGAADVCISNRADGCT